MGYLFPVLCVRLSWRRYRPITGEAVAPVVVVQTSRKVGHRGVRETRPPSASAREEKKRRESRCSGDIGMGAHSGL